MADEARILLLEDEIADAELVKFTLDQSGLDYKLERVETREAFQDHLTGSVPDLILADYYLPDFSGLAALEMTREQYPDLPFIFVTGTLGEERAIETFQCGATDYVLKTRLFHLVPAVHRALREAAERTERRRAEEQLRESREQLRALSMYLQYVREEERTRIAREVHDTVGQALTALKMDLAWLSRRLPRGQSSLKKKAREIGQEIDRMVETVRRIATELRPGILDDLGLVAALEWQANEFQSRTGTECVVTSTLGDSVFDADLNTVFFRIFQEALTNIMRHANATRVTVDATEKDRDIVLAIRDNGRGITDAEIRDTGSIGLVGMRERAMLLGGRVTFDSEPGEGTLVTVTIPRGAYVRGASEGASHENFDRG